MPIPDLKDRVCGAKTLIKSAKELSRGEKYYVHEEGMEEQILERLAGFEASLTTSSDLRAQRAHG
jgi:hypothetical protein